MNKKQFKQHRKDLNLTQRQLADRLGLSPKNGRHYVRMIEKGNRVPSDRLIRHFELLIEKESDWAAKAMNKKGLNIICTPKGNNNAYEQFKKDN